ncbi:hypothetical protein ACFY94_14690 [Streptomyces griseorubiginosus]|uniref:hypothetical protein n=1 Tax=Streptomyces griseorubiginosus TaxID=67304 RepID=UPI0036EE93D4
MNAFLTAAAFAVLIAAAAYVIHRLNIQHADGIAVHQYSARLPGRRGRGTQQPPVDRTGPSRRPPANGGTTATAAAAVSRRAAAAALPLTTGDQPVSPHRPRVQFPTRPVPTCVPEREHPGHGPREERPGPMNRGIRTEAS